MNKSQFFRKFTCPMRYAEFVVPSMLILLMSLAFMWMNFEFGGTSWWLCAGGVVTSVLLLFRTRMGTICYFGLIFWLIFRWSDRGVDLSLRDDLSQILCGFMIFVGFIVMGWEQGVYHFRHRHQSALE